MIELTRRKTSSRKVDLGTKRCDRANAKTRLIGSLAQRGHGTCQYRDRDRITSRVLIWKRCCDDVSSITTCISSNGGTSVQRQPRKHLQAGQYGSQLPIPNLTLFCWQSPFIPTHLFFALLHDTTPLHSHHDKEYWTLECSQAVQTASSLRWRARNTRDPGDRIETNRLDHQKVYTIRHARSEWFRKGMKGSSKN